MKKIKWENIAFIIVIILDIICLTNHITLNGLYFNLIYEIIVDLTFAFLIRYIVKDIRKNPDEWKF